MALWIHGGQIKPVEDDGVTLMVRQLTARQMVAFLLRAQVDPRDDGAIDEFHALIKEGCAGWSGVGAPEFNDESVEALSLGAAQRIVTTIIKTNSMSETDRGNSHAS